MGHKTIKELRAKHWADVHATFRRIYLPKSKS